MKISQNMKIIEWDYLSFHSIREDVSENENKKGIHMRNSLKRSFDQRV